MNASRAGVFKMSLKEARYSALIFWSIMIAVNLFLFILFTSLDNIDGEVNSAGVSPMYVYMFVSGIVGLRESLPYALGMSVRRKDYFFGVKSAALCVAAGFALFATLMAIVEEAVSGAFGITNVRFFHAAWFDSVGVLGELAAHFVFLSFFFALGFFFSLLQKRFGAVSLYLSGALLLVAIYGLHLLGAWPSIFRWLYGLDSILMFAVWLVPVAAAVAAASYLLIRKATP